MKQSLRQAYSAWWLGNKCRRAGSGAPFRIVKEVICHGPPSFVYGFVELVYEDGSRENIAPVGAYRPRKTDVEVEPFALD